MDERLISAALPEADAFASPEPAAERDVAARDAQAPMVPPLPAASPLTAPSNANPNAAESIRGVPGRRPVRKVLVVDDSPLMLESAAALLESEGYEVRTAADGVEAIEIVAAWQPGIVLLDVHMPRLNGIETARRLRSDHPGRAMRLLMMSGVTLDEAWLGHAKAAGFDDCFDKAADPEVWLASIERLWQSLEAA